MIEKISKVIGLYLGFLLIFIICLLATVGFVKFIQWMF